MNVRLIASDLDGTLFGPDHTVQHRTVQAVNAAVRAGISVAAVTGRSHFRGADLAVSTGAKLQWFVGSNGGHRLKLPDMRIDERLLFEQDQVGSLVEAVSQNLKGLGIGFEHGDGLRWTPAFNKILVASYGEKAQRANTSSRTGYQDVGKIFISHPDHEGLELVELVRPNVPNEINITTSGAPFIEVTPAGADKGSAVQRLCDLLGVEPEDVIAFGDNHNDIPMLKWAGRGIAMGNAIDATKAIADEVTSTNSDFGVAEIIEALLA